MMCRKPSRKTISGFTLLEVMIALLVFSLLAAALQSAVSKFYEHYIHLETRILGTWIAENRLAEMSMDNSFPAIAELTVDVAMGGKDWRMTTSVSATADPDMRRVEILVVRRLADNERGGAQSRFVGFVGRN